MKYSTINPHSSVFLKHSSYLDYNTSLIWIVYVFISFAWTASIFLKDKARPGLLLLGP